MSGRSLKRTGKITRSGKYVAAARSKSSAAVKERRDKLLGTTSLTMYRGVRNKAILPDRLNTTMTTTMSFYLAAGRSTATYGNFMSFVCNSIYIPFGLSTFNANTGTGTYAFAMNGQFTNGSSTTVGPIGYNTLGTLYTQYKVKNVKIKATVQPTAGQDTCCAVLFPLGNEAQVNGTSTYNNINVMMGQPGSKYKICNSSNDASKNTLFLKSAVHEILGRTKMQWDDQSNTVYGAAPQTNDQAFIGLYIQELDGAANVNPICVVIELQQEVMFTDLSNQDFVN